MIRFVMAAAVGVALATPALAQTKTVAITAIVEHPALDAVRDGVVEALKAAGWVPGQTLTVEYQSAQGNPATAAQIARQFVGKRPDVIVPISTPSAQAVVAATRDVPVVFSAVTDPVGAQLVRNPDHPGGNVTGLSDFPPVEEHLLLIRKVLPGAKRIGVPYNPGDANSVSLVGTIKALAAKHGMTVVEAPANRSSEVQGAARGLVGKADVIYTALDNTVVSALEAVVAVGAQNKLPVFSGDTDSVARGTVASIGFNYFEVGRQTGQIVARVLKGEKPGDIPVTTARGTDLVVNPAAAQAMGVTLPADLVQSAKVVGK
ncbi:ABC transporter substrate-binding protein [Azospirillum sp. RWY-5-1]|uniref:ABC transporter substrate-binding protein n=1 Tax=Azospirillum oleiclasticum TaxID=2735135 RepID=A0ABX2TCJ1_9PROT|nr:ABC transporter substrate-binding protein [Azospirillum oleiclasticum]NYZ21520.1 ABC transporter substrate-binding protein [Azospirillum oleiclasticum]